MERVNNLYCAASEVAFIGCIVTGNGDALDLFPATEEHFFDPTARQIFGVAKKLHTAGSPVNRTTVLRSFMAEGPERISKLSELCYYPSASQAGHFFEIINDKLTLRNANETLKWAGEEILSAQDAKGFCAELQSQIQNLDTVAASDNLLKEACGRTEEKIGRMEAGEKVRAIPTNLSPWDENFGGLIPGELYALAGRPGTGKTAALEMMIMQCLAEGAPVSIFEKDMSPQKLIERMACRYSGVQFWRFSKGYVHPNEVQGVRRGIEYLKQQPIFLYNPTGLTADRLCQIARRDIRVNGVKAVFLDHIQALKVGKDLREGLTQASLTIRSHVTETNTPHVVLAHINRTGATGRPRPEDIKEFDQLYGDCDGMMILWNDQSKADLAKDEMMTTKFYTAKNREGGPTEDEMLFDGAHMTFKEKAHHE